MKIEKGKLYYNTQESVLEMPMSDMEVDDGLYSGKIAVHCPTKEHFEYVFSIFKNCNHARPFVYINEEFRERHDAEGYHIITIDQFKEFYPEQDKELGAEYQNRGAVLRTHTPLVNADEFNPNSEEELKEDEEILRRSEERDIEQDKINPHHYNSKGIQPIDYIEANNMNFNEGNVIKYVTRYKEKNGLEDLKKAKVYLQRLIDRYEN